MENGLSVVGKRVEMIDGCDKATGEAKFTVDLNLPGMLYAKILRSPLAHAKILKIDTNKARRLPGVRSVLTHREAHIVIGDESVLDNRVRYVGDKVAAVAATDEEIAEEALDLIDVKYETLPAVFDAEEAMRRDAPILHPDLPMIKGRGNLREPIFKSEVGDVEKGFREADCIFENRYTTQRQAHCALEPHVGIAKWHSREKLTYWTSTQGVFWTRDILSKGLGIPLNSVRVIAPHVGGGFGGKYGGMEDILCAMLAKKSGRPVKLELSREEEFSTTRTRSDCIFDTKTGVKKDGTITSRYMRAIVDMGAYAYGILLPEKAGGWFITPYSCPNFKYEGYAVYTNTLNSGACRGYTSVPTHFATESDINMIAEELGLDPFEFRMKNHRKTGEINPYNNIPIDANGFGECMLEGAKLIDWRRTRQKRRRKASTKKKGVGMAAMVHYAPAFNPEVLIPGNATLRINADGSVHLLIGATDIGQGIKTTAAQIVAEELGVRYEDVSVTNADTDITPWSHLVAGSTGLMKTGGAVKAAAAEAKRQLFMEAARMLRAPVERLAARNRKIYDRRKPKKKLDFSDIIKGKPEIRPYLLIETKSSYTVPKYAPPWGAQFAEVEVDVETGQVKVLKIVAAHDVGRAINMNIVEGQIDGGLLMGIGYALTEQVLVDRKNGEMLNPNFRDYKILRATDMPERDIAVIETISPAVCFGAKGIGEMSHIPTAPAIADAVYDAIGIRIKELPITPERIFEALKKPYLKGPIP